MPAALNSPIEDSIRKVAAANSASVAIERRLSTYSPNVMADSVLKRKREYLRRDPPKYLGQRGARIWNDFVDNLQGREMLPIVYAQLEVYIHMFLRLQRIRRLIENDGLSETKTKRNGDEFLKIHELFELEMQLSGHVSRLWRILIIPLTSRNTETKLIEKQETAETQMKATSERGSLIGGRFAS